MDRPYTSIDLAWLTERLHALFAAEPPVGAVVGRTKLRNAVVSELACSELEAEQLVDTLVLQRRILFQDGPDQEGQWLFIQAPREPGA